MNLYVYASELLKLKDNACGSLTIAFERTDENVDLYNRIIANHAHFELRVCSHGTRETEMFNMYNAFTNCVLMKANARALHMTIRYDGYYSATVAHLRAGKIDFLLAV